MLAILALGAFARRQLPNCYGIKHSVLRASPKATRSNQDKAELRKARHVCIPFCKETYSPQIPQMGADKKPSLFFIRGISVIHG
jgi:hypothetical protein